VLVWFHITLMTFLARITTIHLYLSKLYIKRYWFHFFSGHGIYISIAVRYNVHFVLYHYRCKGRYSINFDLKCLEKSGNLIMTGE